MGCSIRKTSLPPNEREAGSFNGASQLFCQISEMGSVTNIVMPRARQVNLQIQFHFAGALRQYQDTVRQKQRLINRMRHHDDCFLTHLPDARELVPHSFAGQGVQGSEWLIEQE